MIEPSEAGQARIDLVGEIDVANAETIIEQVAAALIHSPPTVTLDLSEVEFIGSSGLSAMVTARNLCIAAGAVLNVANPSRPVRRVLALTGLDRQFGSGAPVDESIDVVDDGAIAPDAGPVSEANAAPISAAPASTAKARDVLGRAVAKAC